MANSNVVAFTPRPRPLRADVPPFDPTNPAHLRAWESVWDFAMVCRREQEGEHGHP